MKKFILSGFSDEYAPETDRQFEGFGALGIRYFEARFLDGINISDLDGAKVREVKEKMKRHGLLVSSLGSPLGKVQLSDDFEAHLEKAKRTFEIANELDCKYVRIFSFYGSHGQRECVLERLSRLADTAERFSLTLCHENEAGIYGESPEASLDLLDALGGKIKCVFDMGNFVLGGYDPERAFTMLEKHIAYFHIKDTTKSGKIVPAGHGDACIKSILKAFYANAENETYVSLEPHLTDFTGLSLIAENKLSREVHFDTPSEAFTYNASEFSKILRSIQV